MEEEAEHADVDDCTEQHVAAYVAMAVECLAVLVPRWPFLCLCLFLCLCSSFVAARVLLLILLPHRLLHHHFQSLGRLRRLFHLHHRRPYHLQALGLPQE